MCASMLLRASCSRARDRLAFRRERDPALSGAQLVTEGARVEQVGVELPKRAVVRVVMS